MDDDNLDTGEPLLPAWGGWQCGSTQGFLVLMAHGHIDGSRPGSVSDRPVPETGRSSFAADVARTFQSHTGYRTSAIALPTGIDGKLALARFLAAGGSSAAVQIANAETLGRWHPQCDWETPLMLVRNRLADEGSKFFVALTTSSQTHGASTVLKRLRVRFVAQNVARFCKREGIGFLGTVNTTPEPTVTLRTYPSNERVAAVLAQRLASITFFCCDAFRTGDSSLRNLNRMRG